MNKHTPGPWVAYEYTSPKGRWFIQPLEGGVNINYPLNEANARLIAAAPELLEALLNASGVLQAFATQSQTASMCEEMARAAIAKATQP